MGKSPDKSTVIISSKQYRVTIPLPLAEQVGLESGQKVIWRRVAGTKKLELSPL